MQNSLASSQRADNTLQISSDLFRSANRSATAKTALILKSREFSMCATTDRIANEFAYEALPQSQTRKRVIQLQTIPHLPVLSLALHVWQPSMKTSH